MGKRGNEATTSSVHVDRNVHTRLGLILIQDLGDFLHRFIMASVGAAHDDKHPYCVLVDVLSHQFRVESELALLGDVQNAGFDLEIPCELLQCNLCISTHDDVWLRCVLSLSHALLLPAPLHCKASKMNCFRRAGCSRPNCLFALLHTPQVSYDGYTSR